MSRRADPARIDEARHGATRNRLIGDGVPEAADAWVAAWEAQAARDGLENGAAYGTRAGVGSPPARASGTTVADSGRPPDPVGQASRT